MAIVNNFNPGSFKEEWVKTGVANKDFIEYAEKMGEYLAKLKKGKDGYNYYGGKEEKLSTSQIRNFFGSLKTIEMKGFVENREKFYMLKPMLAYAYQRNRSEAFKGFKENVLDKSLKIIINEEDEQKQKLYFKNFSKIFEAILAYHRAFGGK